MKNRVLITAALTVALSLMLAVSAFAAEVVQGKCINYDQAAKTVTVEEYDINFDKEFRYGHPTGIQSVFNLDGAAVGIEPEPGDILRIAYDVVGETKKALKVMNVSKQDLRKK